MGGSGHSDNGLIPMGSSGGGFLNGIPLWVYLVVILIGVGLSAFLFIQAASAKRRAMLPPLPGSPPPLPGAAPGGGGGYMIGGIACALLLVLAPLVTMLIMQPWSSGSWIVGRWGQNPMCTGTTVEFTSDGYAISRGDRKPYRLEGDQMIVDGRPEGIVRHDGDRFTIDGETFMRCSGTDSTAAAGTGQPFGPSPSAPAPAPAPAPMPSAPSARLSAAQPVPDYGTWVVGRWSSSDCSHSMEFRADGTGTTSRGEPAVFFVGPNGSGLSINVESAGQMVTGYLDQNGASDAVLRVDRPTVATLNLHRC